MRIMRRSMQPPHGPVKIINLGLLGTGAGGRGAKGERRLTRLGLAFFGVFAVWAAVQAAEAPAAAPQPNDITFVEEGASGDSTGPAPASPFEGEKESLERKDAVTAAVGLSDGRTIAGRIYTTRAKRLRVYNLRRRRYEEVPVPAIKRIEAVVEWERMDRPWRFKEAGNPEKIFTGTPYPVRRLAWRLTLRNDHVIEGHILGQPLYVAHDGRVERFVLHQRQKGPPGTTLEALVYVRRADVGPDAAAEPKAGRGKEGE